MPRSLPSTTDATSSKMSKSCSADRSRDSVVVVSVFLRSKIEACPFSASTSDAHERRKNLKNQFLRGLTSHCFCLDDILLSRGD